MRLGDFFAEGPENCAEICDMFKAGRLFPARMRRKTSVSPRMNAAAAKRVQPIVRAGRKQKKEDKEGISGKKKRILVLKYPYRRLYGAGKGGNNESYGYSEKNR